MSSVIVMLRKALRIRPRSLSDESISRLLLEAGGEPASLIQHNMSRPLAMPARVVMGTVKASFERDDLAVSLRLLLPAGLRCGRLRLRVGKTEVDADLACRDRWQSLRLRASRPANSPAEPIELLADVPAAGRANLFTADLVVASETPILPYQVVTCERLASLVEDVEVERIADATSIALAPIEFGTRVKPDYPVVEHPPNGWTDDRIEWGPLSKFCVRDAVVHGEEGWVTVGPYILEESIRLASFRDDELRFTAIGSGVVLMRTHAPRWSVDTAANLFSGYPGARNYAHWMIDILPAAAPPLLDDDTVLLWPDIESSFRDECLAFLKRRNRCVFLAPGAAVTCRRLRINPFSHVDAGHFPHPARMAFVHALLEEAKPDSQACRLIYVSRRDSGARNLCNEDEIIALVKARGFEVLTLTGMPVIEQVRRFAEAAIVVGPHGAGLTNVIFCRPRTMFLELLPDFYVQWCMRRIASLVPVRYGCVIGRAESEAHTQQALNWRVDADQVAAALDDMLKSVSPSLV